MHHSSISHRSARASAMAGLGVAAAILVAACGQAAASPIVTAGPTAVPTSAGPTAFADWTARQGFGGGSGVHEVMKLANWVWANDGTATAYDLNSDITAIRGLIDWLDLHPATPCWAAYHDKVRADLVNVAAAYAPALDALNAGKAITNAMGSAMANAGDVAANEVAPTDCP